MTLHPQAQGLLDAAAGAPPLYEMPLEKARKGFSRLSRTLAGTGPEMDSAEEIEIPLTSGPAPARRLRPVAEPVGTLVWVHGGGWALLSAEDIDAALRRLAAASGFEVVGIDYRTAPEHPYPAGPDDVYEALVWIAANIAGERPLAIGGDSAGGGLAAVATQRARERGGPALAGQVLAYPVVDGSLGSGSYDERGEGYILGRKDMEWLWGMYVPEVADRAPADVSPLRAESFADLPPAHLVVAEYDPLRDEVRAYADRLREAGVEVEVDEYDDMMHGFFVMPGALDRGAEAIDAAGRFVRGLAAGGAPDG
jgi:acetyl esterase